MKSEWQLKSISENITSPVDVPDPVWDILKFRGITEKEDILTNPSTGINQ